MLHQKIPAVPNSMKKVPFVLLIDDDQEDIEMLSTSLEQHGIKTKGFDLGENALFYLKLLSENGQLPSLIILDYNMPRINGQQLLMIIKNTLTIKHIPVILYSTYISPDLETVLQQVGAYNCITKANTQKVFFNQVNKFKELAYLFHSKHESLADF